MDVKHCAGCENDFYNGKNSYGISKCWCLENAQLVMKKKVHINLVPPWNMPAQQLPNCAHYADFVLVDPQRTC